MMEKISKSKIEKRLKKKLNPILVETIIKLKKINPVLAKAIASPRKRMMAVNLEELDKQLKDGAKIIVPGKILGAGKFEKKMKIIALSASKSAVEKMKKAKSEFNLLYDEIKNNKNFGEYKIYENNN
jgi:large subunit ribosomal protein L18e